MSIIEEYWTGVASQLQVEAEVFAHLVDHNGEAGRARELALMKLVERLIPARYGVGTGLIFDKLGNRSNQSDLIIYEKNNQPQLLAQSTQLLFPIETVKMVIEVKTTVTSAEIKDVAKKVKCVRALKPALGSSIPAYALFGYRANAQPSLRAKEINDLQVGERPDIVCIMEPGVVTSPDDPSVVGLVPLHKVDDNGLRVSRTWMKDSGTETWVALGASRYPVSRFKPYGDRHVFEPGRALLIFASLLLEALGHNDPHAIQWLGEYLPDIATETVPPFG